MSGFSFTFGETEIRSLIGSNPEWREWSSIILKTLPKYNLTTANRVAGFFSQCGHESNDFRVLEENLNYSADGLNKTFFKYFKGMGIDSISYARNPQKIANHVYANRLGNGDSKSGDGWKFRGGGILQLTGRDNYTAFGKDFGMTADEAAAYVRTKEGAIVSACWFWEKNRLNSFCDTGDIRRLSIRVNGGENGLTDRIERWNRALAIFGVTVPGNLDLKVGSRGESVRAIQRALNITADGHFGSGTEAAVKAWQRSRRLPVTGTINQGAYSLLVGGRR